MACGAGEPAGGAGQGHPCSPCLPIRLTPASPERDPVKRSEAAFRLLTRRPCRPHTAIPECHLGVPRPPSGL